MDTFPDQDVTNNTGPPVFSSAAVAGATLVLTFNKDLDAGSVPAPGAFRVTVNRSRRNVASGGVAISGKTVTLTLASAVSHGDEVKVRYSKPSSMPLQSAHGAAVFTFADQDVTNNTPPAGIRWSATLTAKATQLGTAVGCADFDAAARCSTGLTSNTFRYLGETYQVVEVSYRSVGPTTGTLAVSLDRAWPQALRDSLTLQVGTVRLSLSDATVSSGIASWATSTSTLSGISVNQRVSLRLVNLAQLPPLFQGAAVDRDALTLTFSESLDEDSEPSPGAFRVTVNRSRRNVASGGVAVSGKTVTLTLASAVSHGDEVKVRYSKPSSMPLQSAHGAAVFTFADQDVTNNTAEDASALVAKEEELVPAVSVTGVSVVSDPGADKTYGIGDTISVQVTFSQLVVDVDTSEGTPRLKIDMDPADWGEKWASYASGSGTASLIFTHTVVEPNISTQGIAVLANTLELNGGTIRSDGDDAGLSHTGLAHNPDHKVDWQASSDSGGGEDGASGGSGPEEEQVSPASVSGVAVSSSPQADATYALGETIRITLSFTELQVDVDTTGGTPRLKIDMDPAEWGEKWASYESGSGTHSLTFTHTVVEPNFSTQGIALLANTLELNGGDIESTATDTDADLSHDGLAHDAGHKVDWRLSDESPG